jgi:AdoMet-dependent heme synthase
MKTYRPEGLNPAVKTPLPHIIAWEVTRSCNLNCVHCRASSRFGPYPNELNTEEALRLMDQIRDLGTPIIILTGGEPLLRKDIFELSEYGTGLGMRMVMGSNGTLITARIAKRIAEAGVKRVSISIDGATKESHDAFRKVNGAFDGAMRGISNLKVQGVDFQINTTITRHNLYDLQDIFDLAVRIGAVAHHIFLLVPTGRAREMVNQELSAQDYEDTLHWFYRQHDKASIELKATCAPQYYRILSQEAASRGEDTNSQTTGFGAVTRGCLAGISYCFISHVGIVQPCGYLEVDSGDVRKETFSQIWQHSPVFSDLRDFSKYKGKCGRCEYITVCGGCRARAYEATGDYLAEEPLCAYEPGT